jgi:deoxyribonuclease IV
VLVGAHVSTKGGIDKAVDNAVRIGAAVIQTHPTSAQQWRSPHIDDAVLAEYHEKYRNARLQGHWLHAIYLINLATPKEDLLSQSVGSLTQYMELARDLNAQGVVFHPGSHLGAGFESKLAQMVEAMKAVLGGSDSPVRLLIENSAGSGGCVACSFGELGRLVHGVGDPRIGVCLDTQHMFASGYDIRTPEAVKATLDEFDREVGFDKLALIHANDSRRELGSNVDRHANIGEGEIGAPAFRLLAQDGRLGGVPWLLEVPGHEHTGPDRRQVDLLRECLSVEASSVA